MMLRQYLQLPRAVHVLCLGALINRSGALIIPFLTLYLTKHLKMDEAFAMFCMSAYGVGSIAAVLVGGHLADTVGRRVVMLGALFCGAGAILVFSLLTAKLSILICLLLFSFAMEMFRPANSAMIADLTSPAQRPHAYGLQYIAINLGFAVAAAGGGMIVSAMGYVWLFWIDAGTAIAFAAIILFALRETLPAAAQSPRPSETMMSSTSASGESVAPETALQAYWQILTHGTFMVFLLATLCLSMVYMQAMATLPLYLSDLGFDEGHYGRILSLNGAMIALLQIPVIAFVARYHRGSMLGVSAVVTGVGFGMTALAHTSWQFAATVAIWTTGEMMSASLVPSIVSDLSPTRLRARYMGMLSLSFSAGGVIGIPLGGLVLQRYGGRTLWTATLVFTMLAAGLYVAIRKRLAPERAP